MLKIGILTGSTRDSRVNIQVAEWVKAIADKRKDAEYELVDIKDYNLPRFNEPIPAVMSQDYTAPDAHVWANKVKELDGFIFVTPEYNKGVTSSLKDAIDYLYVEWNNKAAGVVSYGSTLGVTATNDLRLILSVPKVAVVGPSVAMSLFTDFQDMRVFNPAPYHKDTLIKVLDDVVAWSMALKAVRG